MLKMSSISDLKRPTARRDSGGKYIQNSNLGSRNLTHTIVCNNLAVECQESQSRPKRLSFYRPLRDPGNQVAGTHAFFHHVRLIG